MTASDELVTTAAQEQGIEPLSAPPAQVRPQERCKTCGFTLVSGACPLCGAGLRYSRYRNRRGTPRGR